MIRPESAKPRLVLRVEEAAELLGISRALAYRLIADQQLPALRLGRRLVVPRHQLLRLIQATENGTAADVNEVIPE